MDETERRPISDAQAMAGPVKLILAVDVGSSGIRCCAYRLVSDDGPPPCSPEASSGDGGRGDATTGQGRVRAMPGCSSSRPRRSVEPNTGRILLHHRGDDRGVGEGNEAEVSSSSYLLDDVDSCVDDTLDLVRSELDATGSPGFEVAGVGFSSFAMNLIGVDRDGAVVDGATFSYACNVPGVSEECRRLRSELGTERLEALHQRTGCVVHSAYALPQMRHFYGTTRRSTAGGGEESSESTSTSHPPPVVHRWQTIAALCLGRWSGRRGGGGGPDDSDPDSHFLPMSYSEASWTGLLNVRSCEWDEGVLGLLPRGCVDALPPLADCTDPDAVPGGIREFCNGSSGLERNPYWDRWPELRGASGDAGEGDRRRRGCRLFLGVADGACANLGSKCSHPSRVAVTVGTSAAARVCLPLPRTQTGGGILIPAGLFCYRVDGDHVVVGGALSDGGSVVEWARDLLNLKDDDAFAACMAEVARLRARDADGGGGNDDDGRRDAGTPHSHSHRLSVLPFLGGERSTGFRDGATGCVAGLTRGTTPAMFLKACMEGVTLRLGEILRLIDGCSIRTPPPMESSEENERGAAAGLIVASGGALENNAVWRQMIADCTGRPVVMDSDVHESTSRGAARLVAASLTLNDRGSQGPPVWMEEEKLSPVDVAEPAVDRLFWHEAANVQEEFIEAVSPLWR